MLLDLADIDLIRLADLIREIGRPVHINRLARVAVSAWLEQNKQKRRYAPGATYEVGETIKFNGRSGTITSIQPGSNPKQGEFQILTITFADGSYKHMAASIAGAPNIDRIEVTPEQVQKRLAEDGLSWRTAVQDALAEDDRFIYFQDEQGDAWCLVDLLPTVTKDELQHVWSTIQSKATDLFVAVPTEVLLANNWELENDGSNDYQLHAFALNATLLKYRDVQYVAGAGWMLTDHWRQVEQRPSLVGPRIVNIVPEATDEEVEDIAPQPPEPKPDGRATELAPDMELWRQQRRNEVPFTLRASHYYYHWLPLSRDTQHLFPPRPCRVTIYHHFSDQEASFRAIVNPELKRVLGEPAMYDAFYSHGIYPGAKLIISHRGTDYDYDIRTRPIEGEQLVTVRRISLSEEGQLEYWDDDEPLRYQVDGDVFVASARWEDLPALFQQAEEAGQGIFGLMFLTCQKWQKKRGAPLIVTVDELFETIHYEQRMTSKATIAFELWRRLAFESLGQGRYQFQPEKGNKTRPHGLAGRRPGPTATKPTRYGGKKKSLSRLSRPVSMPSTHLTSDDLWTALMGDENQRSTFEAAITAYKTHPFRDKMLFLRETSHQRIRQLLVPEHLDELTLADFNRQVWQLGTLTYKGHRARIDSSEIENLLKDLDLADVEKAYEVGELLLSGNQTWGSATGVYGAPLRNKTDAQKTELLRRTLRDLLYGPDEDERRLARTIQEGNGFGINITSGLLHAVYSERHILYNRRSVEMLTSLGIEWPGNWRQNTNTYMVYRDFSKHLCTEYNFTNLTDVDWFIYGWGTWQKSIDQDVEVESPQKQVPSSETPSFEHTRSGQLVSVDLVPTGPLFDETRKKSPPSKPPAGYFIFQQSHDSKYEDRPGIIYNWRQGIPGSRQIQEGARFIYYRPGEQVFFGSGQINYIEEYKGDDGRVYYNGYITNFVPWDPPLSFTWSIAEKLSFFNYRVLGIGQAGIRKINLQDFEIIRDTFRQKHNHFIIDDNDIVDEPKAIGEGKSISREDEFIQMKALILANLKGEEIYPPNGKPNIITNITKTGLIVQSSKGKAEVPWEWIEQVFYKLCELGKIERSDVQKGEHHVSGGYRSVFIFGLLAKFEHIIPESFPRASLAYKEPSWRIKLERHGFHQKPGDIDSTGSEMVLARRPNQKDLIAHLILVLKNFGGVASRKNVIERFYQDFKTDFDKPYFQELVAANPPRPRWVHNIDWARMHAKQQNFIGQPISKRDRGIWRLSDKGWQLAMEPEKKDPGVSKESETKRTNYQPLFDQFRTISVWRRGNKIAPHKSLLLIYALAQCKIGAPRLIPFSQIDEDMTKLLIQFNPESQSQHPEYPFWRLQNDGLWEIPGAYKLAPRKGNTDAKKSELLKYNISGGFPQSLYDVLQPDPDLIDRVVTILLHKFFPKSQHQEICEAVGLIAPRKNYSYRNPTS